MSRLSLLAALLLAAPVLAQQVVPDPSEADAIKAATAQADAGRYLSPVRLLEPAVFDAADKPRPGIAWQYWQQLAPMLTERPVTASPYPAGSLSDEQAAPLRAAELADALPEIVARARATSIVFLNESHGDPRNRAFALEVARALRPLGYRALAVETLKDDEDDAVSAAKMMAIAQDGYLRQGSGWYSRDPAFGDFLRQAMALGYRPVAYEDTGPGETVAAREQGEAGHLIARALPKGATDKLLVYVGQSHVTEEPIDGRGSQKERWLAARVKVATGIDPLTIDQTSLAGHSTHGVLAPRLRQRSAVLMKDGRPYVWGAYAGAVDLQVVHPDTPDVAGRPGWLLGMGRKPSPVPAKLLPASGTRLIQAFLAGETADAVPIDQVLVTAGQPAPSLMLPPGKPVRYAVEDDTGTTPLHAARQ